MVDIDGKTLEGAVQKVKGIREVGEVHSAVVDVSKVDEVVALREKVLDVFGEVSQTTYLSDFKSAYRTDHIGRSTSCRTMPV
jgi:hypothetical protein